MWVFEKEERKNGNISFKLHLESKLRARQLTYKFKTKVIIVSGHCCEYCDALNGMELTFDEALKKQYLASECCTRKADAIVPIVSYHFEIIIIS
jgi:hypothetical protein